MDLFANFLDETCSVFDNMLICGDINLPKIPWESPELIDGANEQRFQGVSQKKSFVR